MKENKIGCKTVSAGCGSCGSSNVYGMSRVTGYFSAIDNWNGAKQAEFKDRQKGYYKLGEKVPMKAQEVLVVV